MAQTKKKFSRAHKHSLKCTEAQHHQHVRKRLLSKKFERTFVDKLIFVAGPMIPVAIVPQVYSVWVDKQIDGVALPTWIILSFTSLSMTLYALVHREKALIITYIPLFLLNIAVVVGVLTQK